MPDLKPETVNGYVISYRDGTWVAVKNTIVHYSNKERFYVVNWANKH